MLKTPTPYAACAFLNKGLEDTLFFCKLNRFYTFGMLVHKCFSLVASQVNALLSRLTPYKIF